MSHLISIQVAQPQSYGREDAVDEHDRLWMTAFYKQPVTEPVRVGELGLTGDQQADTKHHGGIDKAVLAYSADHWPYWREQLPHIECAGGAFGENLTVRGVSESDVCIGDIWQLGPVRFEVSQPRQPCWKLSRRWHVDDLARRVTQNGKSGWYLRVLEPGTITAGQAFEMLSRPHPTWTITRAQQVMYFEKDNLAAAAELASLPQLATAWRELLLERIAKRST